MLFNMTTNILENESSDNESSNSELLDKLPDFLYIGISVYLFFIMILGIAMNGGIIYVFFTKKSVKSNASTYVVALCFCGFLISTLGIPFSFASTLTHYWQFGSMGCQFHGFILTGMGITMIAILTVIAIDKYIVIVKFQKPHTMTRTKVTVVNIVCYIYGCSWSTYPLFGWSEYELELARLSCSVKWDAHDANHISYSVFLMLAGLIVPVIIISYLYYGILKTIHRQRNGSSLMRCSSRDKKSLQRQNRVAKTVFIMIGAFIIAWLPYSIFSIVAILGYSSYVPISLHTIPSVFAKGSVLSNPIIYAGRNRCMKKALAETFPWLKYVVGKKRRMSKQLSTHQTQFVESSEQQFNRLDTVTLLEGIESEKMVSTTMV